MNLSTKYGEHICITFIQMADKANMVVKCLGKYTSRKITNTEPWFFLNSLYCVTIISLELRERKREKLKENETHRGVHFRFLLFSGDGPGWLAAEGLLSPAWMCLCDFKLSDLLNLSPHISQL